MPLYEYHCDSCGTTFEKLRRFQDADTPLPCPECESDHVERVLSSFATGGGCGPAPSGAGGGRGRFR